MKLNRTREEWAGTNDYLVTGKDVRLALEDLATLFAEVDRLTAENARLRKLAATNLQGWVNVVELGLLPIQHVKTAEELADANRRALGGELV